MAKRTSNSALGAAGALALALATALPAMAQEKPQYGGTLTTTTVNPTLSVLTWDPTDWNWKINQDSGQVYEQLFAADLTKAKRLGGKHSFFADAWLPSDAIRGELAESWEWKENPLRIEHFQKSALAKAVSRLGNTQGVLGLANDAGLEGSHLSLADLILLVGNCQLLIQRKLLGRQFMA